MSISTLHNRSIICRYFYLISMVLFFSTQSLVAQGTGAIKGRVFDKETGSALAGASVVVQGTSFGAAANLEGEYNVAHVPSGKQTLNISYIGYQTLTVQVNVVENEVLKQDFGLSVQSIEGEAVIITAQARGQNAAINQQLTTTGITSVVSSARIQELPDANAAESIGRLPGISLIRSSGEGNEIVVRGIQPRLNLITINNIRMPSTNEYNTSVGLAGLSQYLLGGIEVRKSLKAEDDADVVGGIVDLKLATAPPGLQGDAILEGTYNGLTKDVGSYKSSVSVSDRFFDDKLGVIGQLNMEKADRTNHALSAGFNRDTRTVGNQGVFLTNGNFQKNDIIRDRFGATILLDYKLPQGKIQISSIYNNFDEDRWERNYVFNVASGSINMNKEMRSVKENNYSLINGISLETEIFESAVLDAGASYTSGHRDGDSKNIQFLYDARLQPPIAPEFYQSTFGKTAYDITPYIRDTATNYYISRLNMNEKKFKQDEATFQTNIKMPFTCSDQLSGYVKFGGKIRLKDRNYNYEEDGDLGGIYGGDEAINIQIINDNPEFTWRPHQASQAVEASPLYAEGSDKILEDRVELKAFGQRRWVEQLIDRAKASNWANLQLWYQPRASDVSNDYDGKEKLYAGYAMTELNWGRDVTVNAGLRYEKEETKYNGWGVYDLPSASDELYPLDYVTRTNEYFLPSVTLRYNYSEWGDVRGAYSQSLARPEYYAFIPHYNADLRRSFSSTAGNTHLEPAVSSNFDLILTFHDNHVGLFTVGGFYKEIEKFFYQANFEVIDEATDNKLHEYNFAVPKGQYINVWRNLEKTSYIRGIEIDWQTNFWYLPSPLNGIVLSVNYSKIASKAFYYNFRKEQIKDDRGRVISESRIDTFQTQALTDQPNDIFNLSVGYDFKDLSVRLAYYFQGKTLAYKTLYVETDSYRKNYSRWDLTVRQKLPIKGLSVQFLLSNITEVADMSYTYTDRYNNNEQYYGMTGSLGLRYEFK